MVDSEVGDQRARQRSPIRWLVGLGQVGDLRVRLPGFAASTSSSEEFAQRFLAGRYLVGPPPGFSHVLARDLRTKQSREECLRIVVAPSFGNAAGEIGEHSKGTSGPVKEGRVLLC